jgi:hypothetical protein
MIAAILPILQLLLSALPEFEAIWPVISKSLATGQSPQPADMATLWTAATAVHARVQAGIATPPAASAAGVIGNPGVIA